MVCANSVRTGIASGQFHRSLLVRRLLTRLGGSAKRQRLLPIHSLTCPWLNLGSEPPSCETEFVAICAPMWLKGLLCVALCAAVARRHRGFKRRR